MSSYDPEDRALLVTRRIVDAQSSGNGKWECVLECGHTTVQDCGVDSPATTTRVVCWVCNNAQKRK